MFLSRKVNHPKPMLLRPASDLAKILRTTMVRTIFIPAGLPGLILSNPVMDSGANQINDGPNELKFIIDSALHFIFSGILSAKVC